MARVILIAVFLFASAAFFGFFAGQKLASDPAFLANYVVDRARIQSDAGEYFVVFDSDAAGGSIHRYAIRDESIKILHADDAARLRDVLRHSQSPLFSPEAGGIGAALAAFVGGPTLGYKLRDLAAAPKSAAKETIIYAVAAASGFGVGFGLGLHPQSSAITNFVADTKNWRQVRNQIYLRTYLRSGELLKAAFAESKRIREAAPKESPADSKKTLKEIMAEVLNRPEALAERDAITLLQTVQAKFASKKIYSPDESIDNYLAFAQGKTDIPILNEDFAEMDSLFLAAARIAPSLARLKDQTNEFWRVSWTSVLIGLSGAVFVGLISWLGHLLWRERRETSKRRKQAFPKSLTPGELPSTEPGSIEANKPDLNSTG